MKLSEIYEIADGLAPKALSDEMCAKYGWYDNSGILVDTGEEITGIVFALDLTEAVVDEAIERKANLIFTHHPVIYGKISDINCTDVLGKRLIRCIRAGISVLSMHLNLDACASGIDERLMEGIALASKTEEVKPIATQIQLTGGAYGRVYDVKPTSLKDLAEGIKVVFDTQRVEVYGEKEVKRAASFCGSGADEKSLAFAKSQGAEVVISSDFKHHILLAAMEMEMGVITLTHYASENYGFKKYYEKISRLIDLPCYYYEERALR